MSINAGELKRALADVDDKMAVWFYDEANDLCSEVHSAGPDFYEEPGERKEVFFLTGEKIE